MLKSYLKISLNQLWKHRLYSFINVGGLGVGLATCIVIGLFVRDELNYDSFHENADSTYLISRDYYPSGDFPEMLLATNAPQAAPLLVSNFPQIEQATRIFAGFQMLVSHEDAAYYENRLRFADANVFDFFAFDWLQGDPDSALAEPNTVVLTQSLAAKYFGDEQALGQSLELGIGITLMVSGVISDLPHNTHLSADAFASLDTLISRFGPGFTENWASNNFYTYVRLRPGASIASIEADLPDFALRHMGEDVGSISGMTATKLTDIHLRTGHLQFPLKAQGSMATVYTFIAVAICILLIACINFMNLSTARATQRAREIGMRKALGASRPEVIRQFLGESAFSVVLAVVVAIALVELLLGPFNAMVDKNLSFNLDDSQVFFTLTAICLLTALVAGSYPAFFLSAFESAKVLRGDLTQSAGGALFRNILVIVQFSVAIILMVATAVIYAQLFYARDIDLGYEHERIVVLNNVDQRWTTMKGELLAHPEIDSATASNLVPGVNNANVLYTRFEGGNLTGQGMQYLHVDYDFFATYGIDLLSGREFSENRPTDRMVPPSAEDPVTEASFLLSDLAVRQQGWTPDTALGKWVEIGFDADYAERVRGTVIGVVPDIHFESAKVPVEPVVYLLPAPVMSGAPALGTASIRVSGRNMEETLLFIEEKWTEVYPEKPLTQRFLEEGINALYLEEEKQGKVLIGFTFLAFTIAGIGLFGLATFNAERRIKEIGVRKVMGGSVWSIVVLLTNDFSKLVLLSNLIAWPVAWFAMNRWLENFAYRIDLTPLIFIGSGLIALCIAWVTVGGTAAKAASAKPVLALRYE